MKKIQYNTVELEEDNLIDEDLIKDTRDIVDTPYHSYILLNIIPYQW